jgi:alpha-1,3-glucan synthase
MTAPPYPYTGWTFHLDDNSSRWWLTPRGSATRSIVVYVLFLLLPILGGILSLLIFTNAFYAIKVNLYGNDPKGLRWWRRIRWVHVAKERFVAGFEGFVRGPPTNLVPTRSVFDVTSQTTADHSGPVTVGFSTAHTRRKVLIATLEYEILGWNIKVR